MADPGTMSDSDDSGADSGDFIYKHKMDLRVSIFDRNPVTGAPVSILEEGKLLKVDPTMLVKDVCHLIHEKHLSRYGDKYAGALPKNHWDIFLPPDAEKIKHWGEDVERVTQGREFKDLKVEYLDWDLSLLNYTIAPDTLLWYICRDRPIQVDVFGHQTRVLIDDSWRVCDIVQEIGHKLDIGNDYEYSLKTVDDPDNPNIGWLRANKTLHEQEVQVNPYEDEHGNLVRPVLILKKKLFFENNNDDLDDDTMLHLLYRQCQQSVVQNQLPISLDEAIRLAALALYVQFGQYDKKIHKRGFVSEWRDYLPTEYADEKKIDKKVFDQLKKQSSSLASAEDPNRRAQRFYVDMCRSNTNWGWTYWRISELRNDGGRREQWTERLIGMSGEGITRLRLKDKKVMDRKEWTDVREWGEVGRRGETNPAFFIKFTDDERPVVIKPTDPAQVKILIQYVEDYLWLLRRMRDGDIDSDSDDDPVVLPAATAGTFSMGTRRRRKKKRGGDGDDDGEESPDPLEPTPPEEIPEDPQEALEPIVNTFNLNLNYDIANVLPPPTKKREQLEKMAEARAGIAEKAGAVQLMNLDMLAAVDCGDPRLMNTDLLLAAANDVAKHMQGLIGEALDAAALDPEAGDQYRALVEAVGTNTAGLMAQAQAIALAVNSGDPDAANLNDLLAAANLVGSAINDLIGLAGLPTPAADFQDELKASARLVDTKMNELAEQAGATTFHHMISSQAALLKRQLEQMPVWSNQLVSVVDASAANLKLPLVQIKVKGRVDLLAANMDGFLDDIPDQNEDMLAAARAIRDALAAMSEGIDNIATGAATGNKVDVAYEALTAAVAKLKTEAEEPASVSAVSQDVAGAATEMCRLAQLEVSNDGAAGSHDKLLEAAQDLAAAIAALQGQVGAGDAMNIEAVRAAGSSVNDKAGDLMMERRHISLMREVAETAEEVVAAAGEVLVLFEGPAKAVNNHDDVRAVRAAKKKQQSLHGASRAYVTDPANLKYQDALVHAANQATDKLTPLVTSALAAVDNSDYQLDGNALKKAAQALSAALQDLMGVLGETKRTLWSLDVNNAQEILNEAIERLDKAASEVEAGHLVLDGEVERTQRQHLDDVVASLGAVPGLAEALSDVAIHSKNPPRLAQACRDVAYEVNGLASFATNLAAATGDLAHQQALISRAKEVCLDTKEEIRRGDFAVRNPSDAASDAAMENALAGVCGSISDLEKALPGIGDALKGIETVEAAKASLHPTGLTLDDGGMMLGGTADLASLAGLLSQALEGMIDEGDGTGLLDAPEEAEAHSGPGVQTQNPIDVFKNEITSAGRTLQAAVSRLGVAARDTPDTFSGVASRVGRISTSVIDAVASATAAPELSADKGVISGNTESVADAVIAALTACVDVSKNPDDDEAAGSLAAAARAVGEAFDSLNGAFRAAAENSVGSLEDVDTAVTDINAALGGLDPLAPPPAGASIKAIQDSIIQVADAVSRAMVNLVDVAETDPDRTGDPAKALAAQAVALIQRVAVAAALVPVDGADGDGGEGASSSSGGPDPNAELKGLIEVVTSKLQALVGADPGADKARFTQAATVTVTSTQAVIAKAVEVAERMEEPVYQDALKNVAKSIKSALSKLAKVATIYAEHPEAAEAHDAMVSKIGSLAGKIDKLSRAAATISEQLGSGGSGGSGADDGEGASATTSADMRNALVGTGRELGEGLVDLLGQSKVVATDITNIASHNRLKKRLKENKKVLKALKKTAALLAPGQKECAWAITKSIEEANAITNASLDFSVGKLRAKASKPFEVYFDQLVRVADALSEAVRALAEASYTDAAAVGPAAEALGQALPALTSTVKKVAVTAADPTLGQRVLRECKEVPEAVSTFVRVCKDAGGNPVARAGVEEALAVVMVEIKEIKQVMEEDGAARLDCDAAIKAIEDAAALVDEPTELVPGLGYSDYTKRLKKTLRKTAKAVIKLVDVSSSDPSDLGAAARLIASVFPETIAAVKGNIELTGDDNTRAQIREAAGAWADGVKGLVIAAKAVQGGGSSASGVSAASDATTQALTNLLELVATGATAKHEIQAAARRLDSAVSSLRTTEFMVTTKQISNDGGVSFADVAGRAAQALTATRDAAAQFAGAGDEEALSAATQAAANAAETLLSLAELGASVLENEDDQLALLAAARSLANALGDLIVASGDAVADHEAVDGAKTAAFGESVQTMAHALAHGQEADNRAVNAMAEVSAGLDAALAQLGGPGSSTAFGAPSAAVRDLLRATQKLFFLTTKGRAAQIEFAQGLPPMVAAVAAAMTAVAYNETARGQVTSTVGLIKQLLAQIGAQAGSDDLSDATQGVSQELTALLATLRNAQLVADGADPSALFAEEMTAVTGIVSGAEATIDELIARPPDNSNDVTRNALIEAILAACKEIATGVAFVASVAASPGVEVEGDARENLIVVSRNLGSAMNELTSAASAFVSGEADETYLERAAKVVTNAVVEVIQVVQPALAEDATKRLNKAGRAVGAGYNKLLEACRSLRQDAEAGDDDDDIEELVVDDEGDMMDAESALQAKIRKRAEIARIEKKLANLKRSLA